MVDPTCGVGTVIGQHRLSKQRLGDRSTQPVGQRGDLGAGLQRALASQHGNPLAAIQHVGGRT
jgi:hypothetical protein